MSENQKVKVVGVRFGKAGKIYHFDAVDLPDIKVKDAVIVETTRGMQLGWVAQVLEDAEVQQPGIRRKPVERKATPRDLLLRQSWQRKEEEVVAYCKERVPRLGLREIKVVSAEYSFDGSRLIILVSSEHEDKIDLKSLRQDAQRQFSPAQVELRQIGPRDVAKIIGGLGTCGLEMRCCTRFLTEFCSISIRMAKEQGISLTPAEITGMCGRLRCCLVYEYDHYVELRKDLPKRNKWASTPAGEGKVIDVAPLRQSVIIDIPEVGLREFHKDEIKIIESGGDASKKK